MELEDEESEILAVNDEDGADGPPEGGTEEEI